MKKNLLVLFTICSVVANGQQWSELKNPKPMCIPSYLANNVNIITIFETDATSLKNQLLSAGLTYQNATLISIPNAEGVRENYRVWETPTIHPALAAKYPAIKTYTAESVDNKNITAKIDITYQGVHFMNYGSNFTTVIASDNEVNPNYFFVLKKEDAIPGQKNVCEFDDQIHNPFGNEIVLSYPEDLKQRINGASRKQYVLALACTYEYAVAVTGSSSPTKSAVLSQMVTTLNRVNGVYEREFSATMQLVANNDTLIYTTSSDPYNNSNGGTMLSQNITTCNARIGSANYDIGHVFSTGGGGVAYLSSLCTSNKAGGVTGLPTPLGDPFAIDYVAHEMGHQFGGPHTFNANTGSCNGNGSSANAFEPGSGSTIMAYAGICTEANNLQPNSDAYFHAASLRNITNHLNGTGGTCATTLASTNTPNALTPFSQDNYNIPVNTPFELTAPSVTDVTADTVLYAWEEWDLGGFGLDWNDNNNLMPYFRTFSPSPNPTRVFPKMNSVLANTLYAKGQRIPKVARTLKFVLTVRDIYEGWGAFNSTFDVDTIVLNVVNTTDTFRVSSQATSETWQEGYTKTVNWVVAGTNSGTINTPNVDIYLSSDSAVTFPYYLGTFPNNGTAIVTVPYGINSSKGRIKVKGHNNVFFQVNRANIVIQTTPLSLENIKFEIIPQLNCNNLIRWELLKDIDNLQKIALLKSTNGIDFEILFENDSATHSHQLIDHQENKAYYKLALLYIDGITTESNVKLITNSCENNIWNIHPNPAGINKTINITSNSMINNIQITNSLGKVYKISEEKPSQNIAIDISTLSPGIYFVKINTEKGWSSAQKLVVK